MKSKLLCLCMCILTAKVTCNDLENTDVHYKEISPSNISTIPEVAVEFLSSTEKTIPFTNSSLASNLKINASEQAQTASPVSSTSIPRTYNPDDNTNKLNNETSSEVEDYKSTNQLVTKSSSSISEIKNSSVVQGNAEVLHTENANASTMENLQTAELVQPKVTPTKNTNFQVDQHRDHDHRALGQSGFIQPSESAAILASVFVGIAVIGYAGLVVWRKILEKKYGNREMLVNEEDFSAGNDLRYFEL